MSVSQRSQTRLYTDSVFFLKAEILKFGFSESSEKAQNPGIVFISGASYCTTDFTNPVFCKNYKFY